MGKRFVPQSTIDRRMNDKDARIAREDAARLDRPSPTSTECVVVEHMGGRIGKSAFQLAYARVTDTGTLVVRYIHNNNTWERYAPGKWREAIGVGGNGAELYRLIAKEEL